MKVPPINIVNNNTKFQGQLKLNPRNMDIIDLNLFQYHSGDICEFVKQQKYDYTIEKAFNQIHVFLEEKDKNIAERVVTDYTDGNGYKHLNKVFDAIKSVTQHQDNRYSDCFAIKC